MKTTKTNYTGFSATELLNDDFFIQSHKNRTPETEKFWRDLVSSGLLSEEEYNKACLILNTLCVKKQNIPLLRKEELWKRILETNRRRKLRNYRIRVGIASIAASLFIAILFNIYKAEESDIADDMLLKLSQVQYSYAEKDIQLFLDDRPIPVKGDSSNINHDIEGNVTVNSMRVRSKETVTEDDKYNQLIVPYGKLSRLVLEDGTKLWVNAGTRVIYPNRFRKEKREIFVDGEVYMEVFHDEERPFVVRTSDMDVRVLGTSFNVTSYKDDMLSSVVLVEGSVSVKTNKDEVKLLPNEMLSCNDGDDIEIKNVVVSNYISWIDGIYICNSEPFSQVLNRISRYYGKEIGYTTDIEEFKCSGKLNFMENLDSLLNGLTHTLPVVWSYDDGKYLFKKK